MFGLINLFWDWMTYFEDYRHDLAHAIYAHFWYIKLYFFNYKCKSTDTVNNGVLDKKAEARRPGPVKYFL